MGSGASGKGSSRSQSSSSASTSQSTVNNVDNRVYQSDFGAIEEAFGFARDTTQGMVDVSLDAVDLGKSGLEAGTDNLNLGLNFASDFGTDVVSSAFDTVRDTTIAFTDALGQSHAGSLAAISDSNNSTFGFLGDVLSGLFSFATTSIETIGTQAETLAGQSIAGNMSLAKTTSESADDRVTRLGMYGFLAIGAIMVLPAIFGKK